MLFLASLDTSFNSGTEQGIPHAIHIHVLKARLFTLPEEEPPIYVSGTGSTSIRVAGDLGDGLISTVSKEDLVESFTERNDGLRYGLVTVCYAESESKARDCS